VLKVERHAHKVGRGVCHHFFLYGGAIVFGRGALMPRSWAMTLLGRPSIKRSKT